MKFTGERIVPWNAESRVAMQRHVMRYAWAMNYCEGKRVIDLGCGCGYGAFMLSWIAEGVVGVDADPETIGFAQFNYDAQNLVYGFCDLERDLPPMGDVYVAFEVLEHLDNPGKLLQHIHGPLLWSVPMLEVNSYHRHVYDMARAIEEIGSVTHAQTKDGLIVRVEDARYPAHNVLGVRR